MPLRLTPQMKQRMTRRTLEMVQRALGYFPELKDASITIGYTRKHLGSATVIYRKHELYRLIIRLRVRKVTYHTIGHELTHLVQGLAYGHRGARSADPVAYPGRRNPVRYLDLGPRPDISRRPADLHQNAAPHARTLA